MTTAADPNATPRIIAGYPAERIAIDLGPRAVRLWRVAALERLVDRTALLRGEAEPPYWAHLWAGARVLARYLARWIAVRDLDVLEIGCGLGLPAVATAALGGRVTVVDSCAEALAFVAASAAANQVTCATRRDDFLRLDAGSRCDLLLAAEVAYDRDGFAELAAVFARHLRPNGVGLMTDGYRTDTRPLYGELTRRGLTTHAVDVRVEDEGRATAVRLTTVRRILPTITR
jgi:predicted nicotinamide N-methyase